MIACGVCRTDLHIVDGELAEPKLPLVLGHQVVGEVVGAGPGAERFAPGDRVGIPWLGWACGECRYCRSGARTSASGRSSPATRATAATPSWRVADERFCLPLPADAGRRGRAASLRGDDRLPGAAHVRRRRAARPLRVRRLGPPRSARSPRTRAGACSRSPATGRRRQAARSRAGSAPSGRGPPTSCPSRSTRRSSSPRRASWSRSRCGRWRRAESVVCAGIHMSDIPSFPYADLWGERQIRSVANLTRARRRGVPAARAARPGCAPRSPFSRLGEADHALAELRGGRVRGAAVLRP